MPEPKMIEPTPATPALLAQEPMKAEEPAKTPEASEPAPKEPATSAEPAKEPAKATEPAKSETLLGGIEPQKKEEPKPDEAKVEDAKKVEEAKPAEAEPIKYEPFNLPENIKLGEEESTKFTSILAKHRVPQEGAQELIDLYVAEAQKLPQLQRDIWTRTQEQWKDSVRADPELGGNRIDTVLKTGASVIERFGGTADEKKALRQALALTGAGNHPEIIRFFYRVGKALAEPTPVPATTPKAAPAAQSRAEKRYGNQG